MIVLIRIAPVTTTGVSSVLLWWYLKPNDELVAKLLPAHLSGAAFELHAWASSVSSRSSFRSVSLPNVTKAKMSLVAQKDLISS